VQGNPLKKFAQHAAALKAQRLRDPVKRAAAMRTPVTEQSTLDWLLKTHREEMPHASPLESPTYEDIVRLVGYLKRRRQQ
jgi:hypothetical protein